MPSVISAPLTEDLQCLLAELQKENYAPLQAHCDKIAQMLDGSEIQHVSSTIDQYVGTSKSLINELDQYLRLHRLVLVPYINDLLAKEEDGHNCQSCSGGCAVRHFSHITNIREAHKKMNHLLAQLQPVAMAQVNKETYPEAFISIRTEMQMLGSKLNELFFIEESAMIPMMQNLQRNIGAHE